MAREMGHRTYIGDAPHVSYIKDIALQNSVSTTIVTSHKKEGKHVFVKKSYNNNVYVLIVG